MLPPVDEQIFRDNPNFAQLYGILNEELVNPDGSSRYHEAATECESTKQALSNARLAHTRQHFLKAVIASTSLPDTSPNVSSILPLEDPELELLADLLALLPPLLDDEQTVDSDTAEAIFSSSPFNELGTLLPHLGAVISETLHASALHVVRVVHPSTNPSFLHRHISSLPADHAALCRNAAEAQMVLLRKRLEVQVSLTELLRLYSESLAMLIQSLESKHRLASRNLELRALNISLDAQQVETDAKSTMNRLTKEVYSAEMMTALENYSSHLRDAQVRTAERVRGLQAELADYGVGTDADAEKELVMRDLARKYRDMELRLEDAKNDMARLDS